MHTPWLVYLHSDPVLPPTSLPLLPPPKFTSLGWQQISNFKNHTNLAILEKEMLPLSSLLLFHLPETLFSMLFCLAPSLDFSLDLFTSEKLLLAYHGWVGIPSSAFLWHHFPIQQLPPCFFVSVSISLTKLWAKIPTLLVFFTPSIW